VVVRVLHAAQPTTGGVAHYLGALVEDQVRRGYDVIVACPPEGNLSVDVRRSGARHIAWPARRSPGLTVGPETFRLKRITGAVAPAVVHLHSSKAGLAGRLSDRRRHPTIFQPHGWSWLAVSGAVAAASRAWERAGAGWCDRLLCVSDAERDLGISAGIRAHWEVVRTGVDLARFHPVDDTQRAAVRAGLPVPGGPLAVCVGRMTEAKGQDLLADAWPSVRARVPDAQLALVGEGEPRFPRPGSGSGIHVLGGRGDVERWYAAADAVVVPSRWDAMSLSLVEAAACGRPVVATDVPGAREVLGDSERGVVIRTGDRDALVDAVVATLTDPERSGARAAALGAWAADHVDRRAAFDAIAALTERLAERRQPVR